METFRQDLEGRLRRHRRPNPFGHDLFKSRLEVLHVPAREQRAIAREMPIPASRPEARRCWRHVWRQARTLEERLQCLWPLLALPDERLPQAWSDIRWFGARLENWCESDYLSSLVARCLEQAPDRVLPVLSAWNRHRDPWRRRQSLVGLLYYQRQRRRYPPASVVLAHLETRLADPAYYVQKAVGWTLREAVQVWPEAVIPWVEARLPRISGTAMPALLEKAPPPVARRWKRARRDRRRQQRL